MLSNALAFPATRLVSRNTSRNTKLSLYMNLRATADWSSGVLPEHCTPAWLEKNLKMSRWKRLCCERELHAAGLFESVQKMQVKRIRGRMRWVRQARVARIFAEPHASQNTSNNAGSFSVRFFSLLKDRTPNASSEPDSTALKSSKVKTKFKSTSLPLGRVAPTSPGPEVQKAKPPETSRSALPDLTEKQSNPKPNPSRKEKEPLYRPDLALRSVLDIREKYFLKDDDVRGWMNVENRWRSAGCPADRALLVKFLDDAITSMTREGVLYHPVALLRLKQLRRHEFSPRLTAPSSSLTFTPGPGACPRCGGYGLVQQHGVGKFCDCAAAPDVSQPWRVKTMRAPRDPLGQGRLFSFANPHPRADARDSGGELSCGHDGRAQRNMECASIERRLRSQDDDLPEVFWQRSNRNSGPPGQRHAS